MYVNVLLLVLLIGASARLTRLTTTDTITAPIRDPILERVLRPRAQRRALDQGEALPPPTRLRSTLYTLLTCHWCVGFWIAAAVVLAATAWGHTLYFQVAAAILTVSYALGWLADNEAGE